MKSSSQVYWILLYYVSFAFFIGLTDFLAAQTPDLIISAISTTTGPVAPNATFTLSNSAKNQGTASAGSFVIAFHLSTDNIYGGANDIAFTTTRSVTSLAAGATSTANTTLTIPATAPLGNYYVCALADSNGTVTESNETNNSLCTSSTIQVAAAELIMTAVTPNSSTVNAGATLSVTNSAKNTATAKTGSFQIAFRLSINTIYGDGDDVTISTTRTVSSLAGGATSTATTNLTIPGSTAAGNYYVCAKADSLNAVIETNEANNTLCSATTVNVVRPVITSVSPSSGPIGISVTIFGSGFGATQGTSTVKFNGITATPSIWSATSISVPVPTGTTTGPVTVTVFGAASNGVTFTVGATPSISYIYDELGRLIAVSDSASETAVYTFDSVGNLLSIIRQSSSSVSILEFTPNSGPIGTSVTIYGTGFSPVANQNTVTFNGVTATVTSSTSTQIVTSVPVGAITGVIAVTTPTGSATSTSAFTVTGSVVPTITGFTPTIASAGTTVSVTGTNYEPTPSNNIVVVNITPAQVVTAAPANLTFSTPPATSGKITVITPFGSATSTNDFFVLVSPSDLGILGYAGRMSIGETRAVTLSAGTWVGMVLFEGNASQQVSLNVNAVATIYDTVAVYNPAGGYLSNPVTIGATGVNLGPFTLPSSGTYTILLDTNGIISTVAGSGTAGFSGDGGAATSAQLNYPYDVAADSQGNLFIADRTNHRIRKINTSGIITTVAGTGVAGYSGDGGPATSAQLNSPAAVAIDSQGNLFIADQSNSRIRKVSTTGTITTVAGNGTPGYSGDGGPATSAKLFGPYGVTVDSQGNLFIADTINRRIRKVNTSGIISTVAGNGVPGYSGDGGPATSAQLWEPEQVAVDTQGNLFIADTNNHRIRKVNTSGIITTVAGNGTFGYSGDGGPAISAKLYSPTDVAVDPQGNFFIADRSNCIIRRVDTNGLINRAAGNSVCNFFGDGGRAISANLYWPYGLGIDPQGNLFVVDTQNQRIRKASASVVTLTLTSP